MRIQEIVRLGTMLAGGFFMTLEYWHAYQDWERAHDINDVMFKHHMAAGTLSLALFSSALVGGWK